MTEILKRILEPQNVHQYLVAASRCAFVDLAINKLKPHFLFSWGFNTALNPTPTVPTSALAFLPGAAPASSNPTNEQVATSRNQVSLAVPSASEDVRKGGSSYPTSKKPVVAAALSARNLAVARLKERLHGLDKLDQVVVFQPGSTEAAAWCQTVEANLFLKTSADVTRLAALYYILQGIWCRQLGGSTM